MIRTLRGNRIPLPDIRQQRSHTCGPAVLSSVFNYWGCIESEFNLAEELNSDPRGGTSPDKLQQAAMSRGFETIWHEDMSDSELISYLDSGRPVIITVQAWASTQAELEGDSGHYVIAIDYDSNNVYFEDPALDDCRGYIPWAELESRWHDKDKTGKKYDRFGLVIWKNTKPVYESVIQNVALIRIDDAPFMKEVKQR